MSEWTPEELRAVLRSGDRVKLKKLAAYLAEAAKVGHVNFLYGKPHLGRGAQRTRDDDVQDTLVTLFKDDARLLLKFGDRPDFRPSPGALKRFVIGITWNVLQKRYQDRGRWWEQLEHDLRSIDEYPRLHQFLDLDKARSALSPKTRSSSSCSTSNSVIPRRSACCGHPAQRAGCPEIKTLEAPP
ncbi:hypothetical protein [Nannocystis pusilla]|uniref:hypothetical protein n=1 Tax=Nannocystis pusilla TaxID=889268 RepID=UPI003B80E67D